ncbi:Metabotropic GABA-B receptor subtype 3A [Apophysomyces ossiformis]|uniref:Metabotropic GABA-B receptor subtype 3A n=1 Tax=Apophysomyces ossiformis TaxID=679940 RepID=A0A8H7BVL6_9FUNG|nr:Metabotropic GABA-B receptor subtype 3A [Apophysomyces ossiformis]
MDPVYTIGVMFPDPKAVRANDPTLNNMIIASEVAIQMAAENIKAQNILPDVELNFTRYHSDEHNPGKSAWAAVNMVERGVDAVIGDMISSMTEASAAITGLWKIPQCSSASASLSLSDNSVYPYFFRTVGNVVLFGSSLVDWVSNMGWDTFALIYTNDNVGQQVLSAMLQKANSYSMNAMKQIPLYDLSEDKIEESLRELTSSGVRIVIFADSNTMDQIVVLKKAMSMGLLGQGWVWMLTNDMSPVIRDIAETPQDLIAYDGLMFISGLWELTGMPAYDSMLLEWKKQRVPDQFINPSQWNTTGLSYNAPNTYACTQLLARGLNKALDQYPGGRAQGLADLAARKFNSTDMTPTFFNLNYTGPAGIMDFAPTGDLRTGYFELQYMLNGSVVTYATLKEGVFEFTNDTNIIYLGHTTEKPADMVARTELNPSTKSAGGIIVLILSLIGLIMCLAMMILIIVFRRHKTVRAASPLFCCLQLLGLSLGYITLILYLNKPSFATCVARHFIMTAGFVLVISSIIAKNYRVYRIFQNVFTVRTSRLKSAYLLRIVGVSGLIALFPLIIWHGRYPASIEPVSVTMTSFCWQCTYPTATVGNWTNINAAELVVLVWSAILITLSAVLAWKTRRVGGQWSETNQITYVSYNTALAAILVTPSFFLSTDNYLVAIAAILFSATFTLIVLFTPKFMELCKHIQLHHRLSLWRLHNNNDSSGELTRPFRPPPNADPDANAISKSVLDLSVEAHEGILPAKKLARFHFMSIWELKHVVVVPLKRYFVLMNQSGHKAETYHYLTCDVASADADRYVFRVRTDEDMVFLFQVQDQIALDRWIQWFRGPSSSGQRPSRGSVPAAVADTLTVPANVAPANTFGAAAGAVATFGTLGMSYSDVNPTLSSMNNSQALAEYQPAVTSTTDYYNSHRRKADDYTDATELNEQLLDNPGSFQYPPTSIALVSNATISLSEFQPPPPWPRYP